MDDHEIVVDASVVIKWFAPEQYSVQARTLRDTYLDGDVALFAPTQLPYEVANGLRYSEFVTDDNVATSLESLAEYGITELSFEQISGIIELAVSEDVSVYDAAYVALANQRDCLCYTADNRLLTSIEADEYTAHLSHIRDFQRNTR